MPENGGPETTRPEYRFFGKHSLRGKLFSSSPKEDDPRARQGNDVVDFLQTAAARKDNSQEFSTQRPLNDSSSGVRLPLESMNDDPAQQSNSYARRKRTRRKGLKVTFDTTEPVIIGEGGEESELPPIEVSNSRASASLPTQQRAPREISTSKRYSPPLEGGPSIRLSLRQDSQALNHQEDAAFPTSPPRTDASMDLDAVPYEAAGDHRSQNGSPPKPMSMSRDELVASAGSKPSSEGFASIYASYNQNPSNSPDVVLERAALQPMDRLTHKNGPEAIQNVSLTPFFSDYLNTFGNSSKPVPPPQPINTLDVQPSSYGLLYAPKESSPSQAEAVMKQYEASAGHESDSDPSNSELPTSSPPKTSALSFRNDSQGLGEDALNDFSSRVQRFNPIFKLGAANHAPLNKIPFKLWIRAATWWFLKGRGELESAVRRRPSSRERLLEDDADRLPSGLRQAYLNLAKACWILGEVAPGHEEIKKYGNASIGSLSPIVRKIGDFNLAELLDLHQSIASNMRALAMSMERNHRMPSRDFEPQGLDSRIWLETPRFSSVVASILAGASSRSLLDEECIAFQSFPFPLGDTVRHFNYGSMFVDATLQISDVDQEGVHLCCILTIMRQKNNRELEVVLASQDGQVNLTIQSRRKSRLTWRDVHWELESSMIALRLAKGLDLKLSFQEQNLRSLWGIYHYTRGVRKKMDCGDAEVLAFAETVPCFHYVDSPDVKAFPPAPVHHCDVFLFEKSGIFSGGSGRRRFYDGHRLLVVTPPSTKTLSSVNQDLGKQCPIFFSFVRGEDDRPALLLKNDALGSTSVLTFADPSSRDRFQALLDGTLLKINEICTRPLPLRNLTIETFAEESAVARRSTLCHWQWYQLRIINIEPHSSENKLSRTTMSESLRLWAQCDAGTFVDRVNIGPGELQISLAADEPTSITVLRPPQQDMTVCFASNLLSTNKAQALSESMHNLGTFPSKRTYIFNDLIGTHQFQASLTGFSVLYDGFATNYIISRKRMMVPIHKRWEASVSRLQIVQRDTVVQLLAFFKDFHFGSCMNFVIKGTDKFEVNSKSEQYCVRIIDAKFPLPKKLPDENHTFLCLDMPEYPSEHDDITIVFDGEEGKLSRFE